MKAKIFFITSLSLIFFKSSAQTLDCGLTYFYDNAGNRIIRMIVPCPDTHGKKGDSTDAIAGIENISADSATITQFQIVMIAPNPTAGPISITCNQDLHDAAVTVSNMTGSVVQRSVANGRSIQLNISHLVAGAYTVAVSSNGALTAKTIVKMH